MSNAKKLKFDALDEKNYLVWIRRVKDHITMDPDEVDFGDPVSLLVFLRKKWRSKTPFDRNILRDEFTNFNFAEHKDMDVFITNFKQHVRLMKEHDVGMVNADEDVLYHLLHKVLPTARTQKAGLIFCLLFFFP